MSKVKRHYRMAGVLVSRKMKMFCSIQDVREVLLRQVKDVFIS